MSLANRGGGKQKKNKEITLAKCEGQQTL